MRLITFAELQPVKGVGFSRVHLGRLVKAGKFPAPVSLSEARIAWIESEIDRWIADRCATRSAAVVQQLPA